MEILELQDYKKEFEIIEKCRLSGMFINENSLFSEMANTYSFIKHNYETVKKFYLVIGQTLQRDEGFFYFYQTDYDIEDINASFFSYLVEYIDICCFLTKIDSNFSAENDYVFRLSSYEERLNSDVQLQNMIEKISQSRKKATNRVLLESLFSKMKNDGFIEVFNNKEGKYKLLKSFKFIEDAIMGITEYE